MSHSTVDASNCIVMVKLTDLSKPDKLSKWIRILAYYKTQYLQAIEKKITIEDDIKQDIDNDDIIICNQLSEFIYINQLTGYNFIHNFTKTDFENIINIINSSTNNKSTYNITKFEWIWKCIQHAKTNTNNNSNNNKLQWIYDSWTQFQIFDNSDIMYHKSEQESVDMKQEYKTETQIQNEPQSDNNKLNTETQVENTSKLDNKQSKQDKNVVENQVDNNMNIGVNDNKNNKMIYDTNIDSKNNEHIIEKQKHLENENNNNDKYIESNGIENGNNNKVNDIYNDKSVESGTENNRNDNDSENRSSSRNGVRMAQDDIENQCTICGCCIF
eukprot:363255_1